MMDVPGFSQESLDLVNEMLDFAGPADKYFPSNKKKCPPSTTATGTGYCKNPNPDKAGYILAIKKQCPPNTRAVGAGYCKVDHAEPTPGGAPCPDKKPPEPPKEAPKPTPAPSTPTATTATQSDPATQKDPAQKKPPCVKKPEVPGVKPNQFAEDKQSLDEKRKKIKSLQSQGHPASILIKQVRDHDK